MTKVTSFPKQPLSSDDNQEKSHKEYLLLRDTFIRFLNEIENSQQAWEIMEDIITLRTSFLIDRVLDGMHMDFEVALNLLQKHNAFTTETAKRERDILIAAINNLVDFAAAEEFAMINEIAAMSEDELPEEIYESICEKYNQHYATVENNDVLYAAGIASWWITQSDETMITFMTQGDERVREWHLSLEGITYPKRNFPPELIPPIEFSCRCYLMTDSTISRVTASIPSIEDIKKTVNPVFSESLATGGRIFSEAHRYFTKEFRAEPYLQKIISRLKNKLWKQ